MMLRQILLVIFAFIFLSTTIVNASKVCKKYSQCQGLTTDMMMEPKSYDTTHCEDACVYYKCVTYAQKVFEGYGCFTDFAENCAYISTKAMTHIVEHLKDKTFEYFDKTVMVATSTYSLDGKTYGARYVFAEMEKRNFKSVYATFGTELKEAVFTLSNYASCPNGLPRPKYDDQNDRYFAEKVQCSTRGWCDMGEAYDYTAIGDSIKPYGIKSCDACVYYRCTLNGTYIMGGYGCYEDFDRICQTVPSEVKESIKNNIKSSFHYNETYVVVTCSNKDNCFGEEYRRFIDVHPFAEISRAYYPSKVSDTCKFGVVEAVTYPPPQPAGSVSLGMNIWMMLFGVILTSFGYIFKLLIK